MSNEFVLIATWKPLKPTYDRSMTKLRFSRVKSNFEAKRIELIKAMQDITDDERPSIKGFDWPVVENRLDIGYVNAKIADHNGLITTEDGSKLKYEKLTWPNISSASLHGFACHRDTQVVLKSKDVKVYNGSSEELQLSNIGLKSNLGSHWSPFSAHSAVLRHTLYYLNNQTEIIVVNMTKLDNLLSSGKSDKSQLKIAMEIYDTAVLGFSVDPGNNRIWYAKDDSHVYCNKKTKHAVTRQLNDDVKLIGMLHRDGMTVTATIDVKSEQRNHYLELYSNCGKLLDSHTVAIFEGTNRSNNDDLNQIVITKMGGLSILLITRIHGSFNVYAIFNRKLILLKSKIQAFDQANFITGIAVSRTIKGNTSVLVCGHLNLSKFEIKL